MPSDEKKCIYWIKYLIFTHYQWTPEVLKIVSLSFKEVKNDKVSEALPQN